MRCIVCDEKVRWWQNHCYRTADLDGTGEKIAVIHYDCILSAVAEWIYQELLEELEAIKHESSQRN